MSEPTDEQREKPAADEPVEKTLGAADDDAESTETYSADAVIEKFYSESQERDERGRFAGGSAEGQKAETAIMHGDHKAAAAYHREAQQKSQVAEVRWAHGEAAAAHESAAKARDKNPGQRSDEASKEARGASERAHETTRVNDRAETNKMDTYTQRMTEAPFRHAAEDSREAARAHEHAATGNRRASVEHPDLLKAAKLHEDAAALHTKLANFSDELVRSNQATTNYDKALEAVNNLKSHAIAASQAAHRATESVFRTPSIKLPKGALATPKKGKKYGAEETATVFSEGAEVLELASAGPRAAMRLAFAASLEPAADAPMRVVDGVEYVVGKPIHIFPSGAWTAVDGRRVEFTAQDAEAMVSDLRTRHSDVALTFDHETDKARGSEAAGWMPVGKFSLRGDGLWNDEPLWRKDVYATLIATGAFRYLSGDALGIGSANQGDAFHPRRLLAASLVPKPGFVRGLKGITLAADVKTAVDAWLTEKETFMTMSKFSREELCQKMGLSADSSVEDLKSALDKFLGEEAKEPEHEDGEKKKGGPEEEKLAAEDDEDEKKCEDPNCDDPDHDHEDEEEEKMGANEKTPVTGADDKMVAEKFAALGTEIADKAVAAARTAADEAAEKRISQRFAADEQRREVDTLIGDALKDGRLKGDAQATVHREIFAASFELGKKSLESLPKGVAPEAPLTSRNAFVTGGAGGGLSKEELVRVFDNPERDPRKYAEQGRILTSVARFSANMGVEPAVAWAAVCRGENEALEREIFSAEGKTAEEFMGEKVGQFRASQRQVPIDPEMVEFIRKRADKGAIPAGVIPTEIQKFASISDFQPSARTTLPMALGYFQAEFVGDEALPVFVGGADEKAAWPEFAFEKFAAIAQAAGLLAAPSRTSLNVTWHTVTLDKYPVQVDIDRRARAASVTLPRGIDTIALENVKSQVGTSKELAQATFLQTNGNYYDNTYYPTLAQPWSNSGTPAAYVGLPMDDITKGMAHLRSANRTWPDLLLLSPNAALALRKNQQIIDTVRYTGTQERPGTMVPNSTLAAIFAGLLNLTIVVGEAGSSSLPSGAPVSDVWGNDAWLICTGKGKIEAPRFGITVAAAGSPRVRAFPQEGLGADGADSIVYTDAWSLASVSKKAGYWMKGASAAL